MMRLLGPEDELLEGEDDDLTFNSGHECICCQAPLMYTEEAFLLEVVDAVQSQRGVLTVEPIQGEDGDYAYTPCIIHFDCWEECLSLIEEATEDAPPYEAMNGIVFCTRCQSTIAANEPFIASTFGEVRMSRRTPEGVATERFERLADQKPVCLACMVHVVGDYFECWEDLLNDLPVFDDSEEDENE